MAKRRRWRPTADDRQMGARFRELRLRLRSDLEKHQAFGDALHPPVTAQTVRNWQHGRPIPDKMKRAIAKVLGCQPADFYEPVGAPLRRNKDDEDEHDDDSRAPRPPYSSRLGRPI